MRKLIKIGNRILAIAAFAALMIVNVQFGAVDLSEEAVAVPNANADIVIECGSRNSDCFTYDDGTVRIEISGGIKDIRVE
ncbi:hypothetical protein [Fodinibius halophilus]|uniref:Uncharacterized protein n=1 Tax=Fodinibius halophilus TaxID=1736908 RepID=A0A6M1T4F0_9BACT|nr:hypothetical protein [Fodinibius halophilus]NGP88105.1 hypothetical protein [Fodinibius halophilus]